ncbi:unnamed protein product [Moneuplotes crassus]|uniref:Uncharacterized protein n=1 Tax=Euplotes crassus TaxID=5936 RepID=A0AAD1UDR2_EUPCR|nr:unnamed protein product [Moneuplotes crassus]
MGQEDSQKRLKIMQNLMKDYSANGSLSLEYEEGKGTYTLVQKDLSHRADTLEIPASMIMSVYDEFPFKKTLMDVMEKIPETANFLPRPRNPNDIYSSAVLLTMQVLVNLNVKRKTLDSKFPQYKDVSLYIEDCEVCHDFIFNLPTHKDIDHPNQWEKEEVELYQKISIVGFGFRNIGQTYDRIIQALKEENSPEAKFIVKKVIPDKKQFIWAYNMVNTRSFVIKIGKYAAINGLYQARVPNMQLNRKFVASQNNALIPVFDVINMIVPQRHNFVNISNDDIKKYHLRKFYLVPKNNSLSLQVDGSFKQGEEYGFAYTTKFACKSILSIYGFAVKNGLGEQISFSLENEIPQQNYELCAVVRCVANPNNLSKTARLNFKISFLDDAEDEEALLNFYRITVYDFPPEDLGKDIKSLGKHMINNLNTYGYISIENEIKAVTKTVGILEEFYEGYPLDIPDDLESLPNRKKMSYYCAIDQRNVVLWHITNLHNRLVWLITQEAEERNLVEI